MKIGIVGYGMMGASLHLALLDSTTLSESDTEVRLFVRDTEQQSYLAKRGIRSSTDLGECDCLDLVIICVNLASVEPVMGNLAIVAGSFKITDISSVKKRIAATGKRLFGARYTSSHPIAGSDRNGLGTAIDNLFTSKMVILNETEPFIAAFWTERVKMRVTIMSPSEHDRVYGLVSHLPQFIAHGKMAQLVEYNKLLGKHWGLHSRLSGSDAQLWAEIFEFNQVEINALADAFCRTLSTLTDNDRKNQAHRLRHIRKESINSAPAPLVAVCVTMAKMATERGLVDYCGTGFVDFIQPIFF